MWTTWSVEPVEACGLRLTIAQGARLATMDDAIEAWQHDADFRSWFNARLAEAPYTAFRWETPAVTASNRTRPFEFVLLDSPGLAPIPFTFGASPVRVLP